MRRVREYRLEMVSISSLTFGILTSAANLESCVQGETAAYCGHHAVGAHSQSPDCAEIRQCEAGFDQAARGCCDEQKRHDDCA